MANFVADTFTGTNTTLLTAHTGETGATWTVPTGSGTETITSNRIYCTATPSPHYASGTPASADYDVTCGVYIASAANVYAGVIGRASTSADTSYYAALRRVSAGGGTFGVYLAYVNAGSNSGLGSVYTITPGVGETHTITLRMRGNQISALYDGVVVVGPVTDSNLSAAGKAGVRAQTTVTTTTGFHIDWMSATDPVAKTLTGVGTLTATAQKAAPQVAAALPGQGALGGRHNPYNPKRSLAGAGALTAVARAKFAVAKSLPGTGALTATARAKFFVVKTLPGTGALTATAFAKFLLTKSLPGVGTLAAPIKVKLAAALPGTGALTAQIVPKLVGGLRGTGVLTATAEPPPGVPVSAALSGAGVLSVTTLKIAPVAKTLPGLGTLSAVTQQIAPFTKTLPGSGALTAVARAKFALTRNFTGVGALSATARMYQLRVTVARTGLGTLTAVTVIRYQRSSPLAGSGLVALTHQPVSVLTETFAAEDDAKWDFHGGLVVAGQLKLG